MERKADLAFEPNKLPLRSLRDQTVAVENINLHKSFVSSFYVSRQECAPPRKPGAFLTEPTPPQKASASEAKRKRKEQKIK